jgi:Ca-activated chloride channel homolog
VTLQEPLFLLALLLVPAAALLYWRRERRLRGARAGFAAPALMPAVAPVRPGWRRHVPPAAYLAGVAVLAVALARPATTVSVPVEQARIVLVTDHSGSMAAEDVLPTRLDAARRAANDFLDRVPPQVQVGAIAFNQDPRVLEAPTRERLGVRQGLASLEPAGSTATGDALQLALRLAQPPVAPGERPPPAAIVLISDGASVRGSDPLAAARDAARLEIPVYTVALGTPEGTIPREGGGRTPVPPDPATLQRIADISGGAAFEVDDADRLSEVYERLGSRLTRRKEERQVTAGFAGGGLALLLVGAGLSLWWFGRLP